MNEEIKALIEREDIERRFEISQKGIDYFTKKKGIHNVVGVDPAWLSVFNDAYEIGHKDALSLFKWRKAEDELPEEKDKPYQINIKDCGGNISTFKISTQKEIDHLSKYLNYCQWTYIPQ